MTELPHVDSFDPEDHGKVASQPRGDAAGKEDQQEERVELDLSDPQFMASAYDKYADMRAKGPVSRVRFAGGEEESEDNGEQRDGFFARETFFVTHYDEVVATLLDRRFAVDPRSTMSPEQVEQQEAQIPEEFRLFSRSIISIDPPDHTRLRKLVQPSFTGRGMEALRGSIQQIADDLLDQAEREAAGRGEATPDRRMDLIEAFAYPFPVTVISDMLD